MLVLVRAKGESILIGDDVEVCLLSLNGKEARIGINAPRNVAVDRREVRDRKRLEPECEEGCGDEKAE
jgi:carbon storage regulator